MICKETYQGCPIYWGAPYSGRKPAWFTTDNPWGFGQNGYKTIAEARQAIDANIEQECRAESEKRKEKILSGAIRAERDGDTVTLYYAQDRTERMSIWQFRSKVFEIEEREGRDVVFI